MQIKNKIILYFFIIFFSSNLILKADEFNISAKEIMFDKNRRAKIGDFGMSIKYDEVDCISGKKTENEYGTFK